MNNCYCGHPEERHRTIDAQTQKGFERFTGSCKHCACSEYTKETKASDENIVGDYYFTVKKAEDGCGYVVTGGLTLLDLSNGGKFITQGKDANDVFSMVADAYLTALDIPAKPQKEPKKCCDKCNRKQLGGGTSCIDLQCPCHQKETEPSRL